MKNITKGKPVRPGGARRQEFRQAVAFGITYINQREVPE